MTPMGITPWKQERWGTFSVADHTLPYAFIADVLLYDKLVIPYPPADERKRWIKAGWKPDHLDDLLETLDDHGQARIVLWDSYKQEAFKDRFDAAQGMEQEISGYQITRFVLADSSWDEYPEDGEALFSIGKEFQKDLKSWYESFDHQRKLEEKLRGIFYDSVGLSLKNLEIRPDDEDKNRRWLIIDRKKTVITR